MSEDDKTAQITPHVKKIGQLRASESEFEYL